MLHEYVAQTLIQDRERQLIWQLENQPLTGERSAFGARRTFKLPKALTRLAHRHSPRGHAVAC
jgi:hypothetical protein